MLWCFVIGLSGVYSVMDHYKHEKMRAVEYVSTMHKAMDGVENFDYYSPTSLLKKLNEEQLKRYCYFYSHTVNVQQLKQQHINLYDLFHYSKLYK